jgi:hypothetical protein
MNDIGTTSNNLQLRMARGLSWNFDKNGYGVQGPEKTEEEKKQETINSLPVQKELSEEEKEKLEQLKDMLTQILASADTPPTREQKSNIRRIEKEIENLTGMKMSQSNSQVLDKMPTQDKDEEKKEKNAFCRIRISETGSTVRDIASEKLQRYPRRRNGTGPRSFCQQHH